MNSECVYVVMCTTGDGMTYSVDILVAVYSNKDEADYHVLQAQETNDRLVEAKNWKPENIWDPEEEPNEVSEYRVDIWNVYDSAPNWLKDVTKT